MPWKKSEWSAFIHRKISAYWYYKTLEEASQKSSLKYFDLSLTKPQKPHQLWPSRGCPSRVRVAASIRAKLISGSYILQSNRAAFNQNTVDKSCPLCSAPMDDLPHFLLECPATEVKRRPHMTKIQGILKKLKIKYPKTREERCHLLLNTGTPHSMYDHNRSTRSSSTRSNTLSPCLNDCDAVSDNDCAPECDDNCDLNCDTVYSITECNTVISRLRDTVNVMCLDLHNRRTSGLSEQQVSRRSKASKAFKSQGEKKL